MPGIADVVEAVAANLAAVWAPAGPAELARREFRDTELTGLTGRKVWLFARGWEQVGKAARGVQVLEYRVGLVVAERYPDQGEIPQAWIDERTAWVQDAIVGRLGDERRRPTLQGSLFVRKCWPQRAQVMDYVDQNGLRYEGAFCALVEIDYRRLVREEE